MFPTTDQLAAGVDHVAASPRSAGRVEMIVRRPEVDQRQELAEGRLDPAVGLEGDSWRMRLGDVEGAIPGDRQLTVMNARAAQLVAGSRDRWPLAGDQIYVDFDISIEHLPAGTRLAVGEAVVEVSEAPHTGCSKFASRFGADALRFVNVGPGRDLRMRGLNASVVQAGFVRLGDAVEKL